MVPMEVTVLVLGPFAWIAFQLIWLCQHRVVPYLHKDFI